MPPRPAGPPGPGTVPHGVARPGACRDTQHDARTDAIDFWRGFALITIFVNHIPGNVFQDYTYSQYGISDAAELFVFLAGWSIGIAIHGRGGQTEPAARTVLRLLSRMVEVYRAQLVITAIALAMLAGAALALDNPLLVEWHNAGPVFTDPIQATVGWVTLLHQLASSTFCRSTSSCSASPGLRADGADPPRLTLAMSLSLYAVCLVDEINLPSWPSEGHWFFNPFCWQLLLVLGFLAHEWQARDPGLPGVAAPADAARRRPGGDRRGAGGAAPAARPADGARAAAAVHLRQVLPDPGRLLHFLGIMLAFRRSSACSSRGRVAGPATRALGRNSLAVFSVGSVASWLCNW